MPRTSRARAALAAPLLSLVLLAGLALEVRAEPLLGGFVEDFASPTWFQRWDLPTQPWNTTHESAGGDAFLRAHIARGGHDGASFFKSTGAADAATLRYRLRLGPTFDPRGAENDVKLPGFGSPAIVGGRLCLAGCGGSLADGVLGYSARMHVTEDGVPGFYVYDLEPGVVGYGRSEPWRTGPLVPGRWYTVELRIAMNSLGRADGVLQARLDGKPVFERRNLAFRATPLLHVGGAWFDFYFGGTGVAPADTTIDIDDVELTTH